MGTQVLYDAGYDPRALAQFFEKIEADNKGENPPEFFSDHPNPEHRVERVEEEIDKLGGLPAKMQKDSPEFEAIKREVLALPVVKKEILAGGASIPRPIGPPAAPSTNYAEYQATAFAMKFPDNWKKYEEKSSVSFAPEGGVMEVSDGEAGLAYGVIVSVTKAEGDAAEAKPLEKAT
jgi:beta-barrel assembly-enhancing protease